MDNYATPAEYLAVGLKLQPLSDPPFILPPNTHCAITGHPISHGYPVSAMVTSATAEFLDCFRGGVDGYVSEMAARCFKNADPKKGNPTARALLIFEDGTCFQPLISAVSAAEQVRPCWSKLVREVWPERKGQCCLILLTTDMKKRLWIRARIGALGSRTAALVYDSKLMLNEVRLLNWETLIACLDMIEGVYSLGFPKEAIQNGLYSQTKAIAAVGMAATIRLEKQLAAIRALPEFPVALLIAQKEETSS